MKSFLFRLFYPLFWVLRIIHFLITLSLVVPVIISIGIIMYVTWLFSPIRARNYEFAWIDFWFDAPSYLRKYWEKNLDTTNE